MKSTIQWVLVWCAAMSLVGSWGRSAQLTPNPYQAIAERNVFKLVPPSQKPVQLPEPPAPAPWPKLLVTGVTDVCGQPQALLEVGGGGGGGTSTIRRWILQGGESMDGVLVVGIDVHLEKVTLAFQGQQSVLSVGQPLKSGLKPGP